MKKRKNGNLKNKKQMLIIIAVISIMVFICVVMQAYIEGYFGDGKGKSTKAVNENSVQKKSDRTDAEAAKKPAKKKSTSKKRNQAKKRKRKSRILLQILRKADQ